MTGNGAESAQYIPLGGERVYAMSYLSPAPRAWVLLCGPFPSDRLISLAAWAKWGRALARNGVSAVRFDYRGTGESTGRFVEIDLDSWMRDVEGVFDWAAARSGGLPVVIHGLGLGGLLAEKVFAAGRGDGLLMWSPPAQARDVLRQGLMVRLSMDMLLYRAGERRSAKDYIQDLKSGRPVQIDGYDWSGALWASGERLALDEPYRAPGEGTEPGTGRPWRHAVLDDGWSPLIKSRSTLRAMNPRSAAVPPAPLNRDFDGLFAPHVSWILETARAKAERHA